MAKTDHFSLALAAAAGVLAAVGMLALTMLAVSEPAGAAFPGQNGKIAFVSDRDGNPDIYTTNPEGGPVVRLTDTGGNSPAWSADGNRIVYADAQGISIMDANGGHKHRVIDTANTPDTRAVSPSFSPDGNRIVYVKIKGTGAPANNNYQIYTINTDGTSETQLTNYAATKYAPVYSPDGKKIAFTAREGTNQGGMDEIYTMNSDGTGVTQLTRNTRNEYHPAYSPDGNKIAFSALDENGPIGQQGGPDYDIYTMNTDGTGVARLTDNTTMDLDPAYSPDGNKIAYSHYHGTNNNEIFTINANGGGTEQQITSNGGLNTDPDWQPLSPTNPTPPGTDTFINGDIIHVPAGQLSGETFGKADPYPSTINVSEAAGFKSVTDVNVTIRGVRHTNPDDIDVLLVGPTGRTAILWSDAGGTNAISVPDLTFDDDAQVALPDSGQITGAQSYMPSNYEVGVDDWPGVTQSDNRKLSTFDGTNPTGAWRLYVFDDTKQPNPGPGGGAGNSFANGWSLEIKGTR